MISIHRIAKLMAEGILSYSAGQGPASPGDKDPERLEIVAYGLEIALGAVVEVLAIIGVAQCLGILPETAAALITQVLYRFGAGGAHCTAYYRCLLSSVGALTLVGWGGRQLAQTLPVTGVFSLVFLAFMVSLPAVWRWAPADTPANPITNPRRRILLKSSALAFLGAWLLFMLVEANRVRPSLLYASALAVMLQTLTITPVGYRLMALVDQGLRQLLPLEGRR
ncbi:MAG: accessory gene regulator B family protein [Thermoanaerobacteraceae bacterium]|nr:accessory gene regulator B family protein [Thermoanaerobacteraceae bacterium]